MSNHEQRRREKTQTGRANVEQPRVARREFLSIAGLATTALGGGFATSVGATSDGSPGDGYGTMGYGEAGFGSVQETAN